MSTAGHTPAHPDLEGDGIDIKKIIIVGAGSLALFAICCVVAYFIMHHDREAYDAAGRPPEPALLGKDEIGIVDQPEFDGDHRLEDWKAAKQHRLNSYGWIDRNKQIIHIPIDKAIDQVVSEAGNTP